jgi:hypothetical protein
MDDGEDGLMTEVLELLLGTSDGEFTFCIRFITFCIRILNVKKQPASFFF